MRLKAKFNFTTLLYIALIGAFAYWVYRFRGQIADIFDVIQQGIWYFVLGTVLVLVGAIYNQATWYASIYRILELPSEASELLPVVLVRRFVTVAAPSGGFSGWVPFIQFARKRDIAVGAVFMANLIYTVLWYSTFLLFLLVGLATLFVKHDLQWFEISAALVMLAADLVMIALLIFAWVAPHLLDAFLGWTSRALKTAFGWIKRDPPISERQFNTFATDLKDAVYQMKRVGAGRLIEPFGHAFLNETLHIVMFYLVALAFNVRLTFGVLVAAYSISVLFFVVSPTPGGLGFVEGTLILVLTTLGVPADSSTVITLAYRGITFWLPFVLGFAALRWFNRHPETGEAQSPSG